MALETSFVTLTIKDYSGEIGRSQINVGLITAANLAARITARDAFIDAVEDVIDGVIQRSNMALSKSFNSNASSIPESDVDKKLLVMMEETTTGLPFSFTIPCRKIFTEDFAKIPGTDDLDLSKDDTAALVTAINAFAKSPQGGDGTVTRIKVTA